MHLCMIITSVLIVTMFTMTTFLQTRSIAAMETKLGSKATYKELKNVFVCAGYSDYADTVRKVVTDSKSIILYTLLYVHLKGKGGKYYVCWRNSCLCTYIELVV